MKLTALNPRWLSYELGRRGQGVSFDCPHCTGKYKTRVSVPFENPLDGRAPVVGREDYWKRTGDDFETLTLSPSIDGSPEHWHGHVRSGEVT